MVAVLARLGHSEGEWTTIPAGLLEIEDGPRLTSGPRRPQSSRPHTSSPDAATSSRASTRTPPAPTPARRRVDLPALEPRISTAGQPAGAGACCAAAPEPTPYDDGAPVSRSGVVPPRSS